MSETPSEESDRRFLNGLSEIRAFFRTNTEPVYFFGPTAFNLLGIDRFVRNFNYVAYYDSWDGSHPRVFSPKNKPYVEFKSSEDINNYLLQDEEVQAFIKSKGGKPRVAMVFFDEETEQICKDLGYELILPSDELRRRLDSKIVTTQLGNEAGAPSVPNVLSDGVDTYEELSALASENGLGSDLVVQTPYGDSGKTTFFIKKESDWDDHSEDIIGEKLKVMKRINNQAAAVEAVLTRHGTVVGPFMTDLTGYPELTPYEGGWCGNDVFPQALAPEHRTRAIELVQRFGERLRQEGYVGFFEFDVLVDLDDGQVYMGEVNPRISGASSMTNVTAGAYADIPLFLFHLLEYMDVDYTIDVDEINERWRELAAVDVWSQLIMKEPGDDVERILAAPLTGSYRLNEDGTMTFSQVSHDWHEIIDDTEAFFLRVYGPGEYRFHGADLGILVTKGRMQTEDGLTKRALEYIKGIRDLYVSEPINDDVEI
ncbi:MAG: biotin carboxylase, partial [Candidatus Nanopelagicales bacterium]